MDGDGSVWPHLHGEPLTRIKRDMRTSLILADRSTLARADIAVREEGHALAEGTRALPHRELADVAEVVTGLAPATPEILMLPRTEMASTTLTTFLAVASRARYARWASTCGIRTPGFGGRPPGRLPAGAAEMDQGGFFTMAHGYHNRYQKTTRQAVRRPLDRPLFSVTVIGIV
jgi:hypothetical protein